MSTQEFTAWLREEMGKVQDKLDAAREDIAKINATLAGQAVDIAHHIKRTDTLQDQVTQATKFMSMLKGIGAFLALGTTLTGLFLAMREIVG